MSHHNSGPRAHSLPIADITDMYSFPSPERPGWLALALDVTPFAAPDGFFSEALVYQFRLRPVTREAESAAHFQAAGPDQEITVDCTFGPPDVGAATQQGVCSIGGDVRAPFTVNEESRGSHEHVRVFAGPRWDPFFSDADALVETITTGELAFSPDGSILGDGKNVLSVVVEFDVSWVSSATLFAVVGETLIAGSIPVRWERFGRPELENAVLGLKDHDTVNSAIELRDLYNAEDVFDLSKDYIAAYRTRLDANLAFWDGLDGEIAWPLDDERRHPLTELLLADVQIIDVSKPYSEESFLEIERAALEGRSHATCGGRSLNDDVMNTLYTFLVNGGHGPRIDDGVHAATRPASRTFPYLVPPNPDPPAHEGH